METEWLSDGVVFGADEVHEVGRTDVDSPVGRTAKGVFLAVVPDV